MLRDGKLDSNMSKAEHADSLSRLHSLFLKANHGQIDFDGRHPDAKTIERPGYTYLLELRPKLGAKTVFGRTARIIRLYYAEPLWQSENLLALHIATKPNGPDNDREQDGAILEAGSRADKWSLASRQLPKNND